MYGTVAKMKVKAGQQDQLIALMDEWWTDRAPTIKGARSSSVHKSSAAENEWILAVVFDTKENYEANAADPGQDEWFQRVVTCLDGEPEWNDGEVVASHHQH